MTVITIPSVTKIGPLPGSVIREFDLGGALAVGDLCYIASDGDVEEANGGAAGTAWAKGVVVSIGTEGAESGIAGDRASVAIFGPVCGFSGMTPGAEHYVSDTAGAVDDANGTVTVVIGYAEAADILFVDPLHA